MGFTIREIERNGPLKRAGCKKGDILLQVDGEELKDYIDYEFFCARTEMMLTVKRGARTLHLRVTKDEQEALGAEFEEPLLGKKGVCRNRCVFCFVEQLPKGMRRTLYVKDEDWRYSLVMGNYVTMSALPDDEIARIVRRKAAPLYISVHTVDEELRKRMLQYPKARPIRPILEEFYREGITFHAQVVMVKGMNDADKLEETISYLLTLAPVCRSLAVVPVGLTRFREGLCALEQVDQTCARDAIARIEAFQKKALLQFNTRFVFASDELYIKAKLPLPLEDAYEDYEQIENGVGLVRRFQTEIEEAEKLIERADGRNISIATGVDFYPFMVEYLERLKRKFVFHASVYAIENEFFGKTITVSGLLTGQDLEKQLKGRNLGEKLLISSSMLKEGETVFLDDMTVEELSDRLGVPVQPIADGYELVSALTGEELI